MTVGDVSRLASAGEPPDPGLYVALGLALVIAIVSLAVVLVHACVAAVLRPPRPLAETSVLGRHIVGLARTTAAFLGFFGGILLTTIIATGSDFYATRSGSVELLNNLWSMFVGLVGVVAYGFWLRVALDLVRLGARRRLAAVDWCYRRWLYGGEFPMLGQALRAFSRWVVRGPWWSILLTFYLAPAFLVASGVVVAQSVLPMTSR